MISLFVFSFKAQACDSSPVLSISPPIDIGGGFFSIDIQVCVGEGGSANGFTTSFGGGLNITAFTPSTLVGNNTAIGSLSGGVLDYNYTGGVAPGNMFVNTGLPLNCFNYTVTLDGNPEFQTISFLGTNSTHPGSCAISTGPKTITVPEICVADFSITAPGFQTGNTAGAGDDCAIRPSEDQIIEVTIPCDGTWQFSLCDSANWNTYLYLSDLCCNATITFNDNACANQSSITQFLTAGTYYITVEGLIIFQSGPYTLTVSNVSSINAGTDISICMGDSVALSGFSGGLSTLWSTLGDGTFIDPISLTTTYIPGSSDIANGTTTLFITTNDINACSVEIDSLVITIIPPTDSAFNYSSTTYCTNATNPIPIITGMLGGTFVSSPAGLNLNPSTGEINLSTSSLGLYEIFYVLPSVFCGDTSSVLIAIIGADPNFSYPNSQYCISDVNPTPVITGTTGGTFTSSPFGLDIDPVTGTINLSNCDPGSYKILYTLSTCFDTLSVPLTVITNQDATFSYPSTSFCLGTSDPIPTITGSSGGVFSINNSGVIDQSLGIISLENSGVGNYTVTYNTIGLCPDSFSVDIEICDKKSSYTIPNVFTPNNDFSNDVFKIESINIKKINIQIFNRWGIEVFSSTNLNGFWDGKDAHQGTYFYIIKLEDVLGEEHVEKGNITLLK